MEPKPAKIATKLKMGDYLGIGFDVDHCLVRYNLKELIPVCLDSFARVLVENSSYPSEIFNFTEEDYKFIMKDLILDIDSGIIMKLGKDKVIVVAYYGFKRLTDGEIGKKFPERKYSVFNPAFPRLHKYYTTFLTFFDCPLTLLIAQIIDKKANYPSIASKTHRDVFDDVFDAVKKNYVHFDKDECKSIADFGYFFPPLVKDPGRFIYRRDKIRDALKNLKEKGFYIFVATNSHYEFARLTLTQTLGDEWESLIDLIIVNSGKPDFWQSTTRRFHHIDVEAKTLIGGEISDLKGVKYCVFGNAHHLRDHIFEKLGKTGNVLFFGDNYSTDCFHAQEHLKEFHGCAVMEELQEKETGGLDYFYDYTKYWGQYRRDVIDAVEHQSFWYDWVHANIVHVVDLIDSEDMLKIFNDT